MASRPSTTLPGWPPVLQKRLAAAYVGGMSVATFLANVATEVPAILLTERVQGWRRADLDAWIARRAGDVPVFEPHNPWHDP